MSYRPMRSGVREDMAVFLASAWLGSLDLFHVCLYQIQGDDEHFSNFFVDLRAGSVQGCATEYDAV